MFGIGPKAKFDGDDGTCIRLYKDSITCKGEQHKLTDVRASVEDGSALESRVTLTRLLAVGVFAFAFKKRRGGEKYLVIEGPDFAWLAEAKHKHIREAMRFAVAVNNAAKQATEDYSNELAYTNRSTPTLP